jgi:hypothetical protein
MISHAKCDKLPQSADEGGHVVLFLEVDGEEDALVVVGGEDEVAVAVDEVACLLRLMAGDDDAGADMVGEDVDRGGRHVSSPDELVDGSGAALVVCSGKGPFEDGVVEGLDLIIRRHAVAEEQAVGGADGEGEREEELADGDVDDGGAGGEGLLDAGVEGFADAEAGLHDSLSMDLGKVVVGQEEMDLVRMIAFQLRGEEEGVPADIGAVGVEMIAVDQLVQDQVAVGVTVEIGGGDELVEVAAMVVDVAGHPDLAFGGQVDDLFLAESTELVLLGGGVEGLNNVVGVERHVIHSDWRSMIRQRDDRRQKAQPEVEQREEARGGRMWGL